MTAEHFDCVIVGAGLSGIGMAYQLMRRCPGKSFVILERRAAIGGTWDLFRYPGIRSDSSMTTLGYSFRPWTGRKSIAGGADIRAYIADTARIHGIDQKIRYKTSVAHAAFASETGRWTLDIDKGDGRSARTITCTMLMTCAGYYRYDQGYTPDFAGRGDFTGRIIHPQFWPEDFVASGKRIAIIGSGATAVTLLPSLAETAAHVTMVQRSPSYVVPWPDQDPFADRLRQHLPLRAAGALARWKSALQGLYFFTMSRRQPDKMRERLLSAARLVSGAPDMIAKHFTPSYNPWDQRLCLAPNGDIFKSIKDGRASIVTGAIDRFVAGGVRMTSGEVVAADVIVTATGLNLQAMGGIDLSVDGRRVEPGKLVGYKGVMYGGVPNLINTMGYVNASWTLKSDLTARFACRLMRHLDRIGKTIATPAAPPAGMTLTPWSALSSGYFARARDITPKQGDFGPWKAPPNYVRDSITLRLQSLDDGVLQFSVPKGQSATVAVREAAE